MPKPPVIIVINSPDLFVRGANLQTAQWEFLLIIASE